MSIPIPHYLKSIATLEKQTKQWTHFSLACPCGCKRFQVYESYLTKEQKALERPHFDTLGSIFDRSIPSTLTRDEDGKCHYWRLYEPEKGLEGRHEKIIIPPCPFFSGIWVWKIICDECGQEFILFDNRFHGYDGVFNEGATKETLSYQPTFRRKCKDSVSLSVKVENDDSYEEFCENCGDECTEEQYADAFSWIVVYKIDEKGKKTKIFESETA
jgi:hypothetical protein